MEVFITTGRDSETRRFAAQELAKYLGRMMPGLSVTDSPSPGGREIRLGLFDEFGLDAGGVADARFDDAFAVAVDDLSGYIAGSNERSILYGVYRFLEAAGCHWARHGQDGEYVPQRDLRGFSLCLRDRAAYRYRGVCIEGSVSIENMLDNVDWVLKAGMNSYFLEFFTPYTFFDRYYSHLHNACRAAEPVSVETVTQWTRLLEGEIKKRGLLYHAVGHGWTCESIGLPGLTWDPAEYALTDEQRRLLAQVDGKRELWHGVPLNTNLCYGNPEARRRVVDAVLSYLEGHDFVDFLHVWLADATNNHCECPLCRDTLPSDLYVMLLNEIDAALTARGLDTRVVFLAYVDLLWAPQREKFTNPDRFVFLFAPITRTYSRPYAWSDEPLNLPPYRRNALAFPQTVAENIAHMDAWRKMFAGDGLAYEYHFMWDHFHDPGYYEMTQVMSRDIVSLKAIGLSGLISDQCQRSFFPTGFPMYVLGRTLWNDGATVEELAGEYFPRTFGADGEACRRYLEELSALFDPVYLRGEKTILEDPAIPGRLARVPGVVEAFRPVIERNLKDGEGAMRRSWHYIHVHAGVVTTLSQALLARETGDGEAARRLWRSLVYDLSRREDDLQPVLDVYEYIGVVGRRFA